jgi:hypothetical protein
MSARPCESPLPFGRVLVAGEARHCLFDGECVRLLDGPAHAMTETGEVGLGFELQGAPRRRLRGFNYRAHGQRPNARCLICLLAAVGRDRAAEAISGGHGARRRGGAGAHRRCCCQPITEA